MQQSDIHAFPDPEVAPVSEAAEAASAMAAASASALICLFSLILAERPSLEVARGAAPLEMDGGF